jgi:hypothetical protein
MLEGLKATSDTERHLSEWHRRKAALEGAGDSSPLKRRRRP